MALRDISAWSIRNPVIPLVFFTGLLLAGIVSFMQMDVTNNPDVDFPAVRVTIAQPGASPTEIENQITQRVESALRSINGVNSLQSTAREGSSNTFVEFEIGTNLIEAVNEVETAIDGVRGSLPDGILEPQVQKVQVVGEPIGYVAVEADDMTIEQLSWFIDDTVAKRLLKIEGMAEVDRFGGVDRGGAVRVGVWHPHRARPPHALQERHRRTLFATWTTLHPGCHQRRRVLAAAWHLPQTRSGRA